MSVLYNRDILRLASSLVPDDKLPNPQYSAEATSRACGSRIAADVDLDDNGVISAIAFRARACAIGQASAAILQRNAAGKSGHEIANIRQGIAAYLTRQEQLPADWPELQQLSATRDYPARHAALLLPYDALLAALEAAK